MTVFKWAPKGGGGVWCYVLLSGKTNVVTFRSTAFAILHDFYCQTKQYDSGAEKMRIIETAAKLIKSDIQSVIETKDSYATFHELSSVDEAIHIIPSSIITADAMCAVPFSECTSKVSVTGAVHHAGYTAKDSTSSIPSRTRSAAPPPFRFKVPNRLAE